MLDSELTLIAVGTPFDGTAIDLTYVEGCARTSGAALADKETSHTVVVPSTVVPGTTEPPMRNRRSPLSARSATASETGSR